MNFEPTDQRRMEWKSGFVSLKDRMQSLSGERGKISGWNKQRNKSGAQNQEPEEQDCTKGGQVRQQFATLSELFQSKQAKLFQYSNDPDQTGRYLAVPSEINLEPKRPKIPVMKLNKEDWNVKFWEERLRRQPGRKLEFERRFDASQHRPRRQVEQRVEVFQGRIEDVAQKLEKVREGAPRDKTLYELQLNKINRQSNEIKSSHEWTDLLKSELAKGTHNPRLLKSNYALKSKLFRASEGVRPIRKIFQDDDEEAD